MRLPTVALPLTGLLTLLPATTAQHIDPLAAKILKVAHIFTVKVRIGDALPPIPDGGDVEIIIPITGDTVTGSALNGTITSGIVRATYYDNENVEYPNNSVYGLTHDNHTFIIEQAGQGLAGTQAAGWKITIGGKYAHLTDTFILTRNVDDLPHHFVTVEGFSVI